MAFQKFWLCCLGKWTNYSLLHLKAERCFYGKTPNCICIFLCSAISHLLLPVKKQDLSVVCSVRKWFHIISYRGFCWSGMAVKKQQLLYIQWPYHFLYQHGAFDSCALENNSSLPLCAHILSWDLNLTCSSGCKLMIKIPGCGRSVFQHPYSLGWESTI